MIHISLDFETYSEIDLKEVGTWKYAEHPSTEILLASYKLHCEDEIHTYRCDHNNKHAMQLLFDIVQNSNDQFRIHAWNANFELAIWKHVAVKKLGWMDIPLRFWIDDQAVAAYHAFPLSLEKCAEALNLSDEFKKDKRGASLIDKFSRPKKDKKTMNWVRTFPKESINDFQDFVAYNRQDVITEIAVVNALPTQEIPIFEQYGWCIDSLINQRGILVDLDLSKKADIMIERYKTHKLTQLTQVTEGEITTAKQTKRIKNWLENNGTVISDLQKDTVLKTLSLNTISEKSRYMLETRQQLSGSSAAKYKKIQQEVCSDGTVKGTFQYLGATRTGRWAGRGAQFQNLPRSKGYPTETVEILKKNDFERINTLASEFKTNLPTFLSNFIRQSIISPQNLNLGIVDYSGIENRIALWLAADEKALYSFVEGKDQYKLFASRLFNTTYNNVTKEQRNSTKPVVLGAQFGMGVNKLINSAKAFGLNLSEKTAESHLNAYHSMYPTIRVMHGTVEQQAKKAILNPNTIFTAGKKDKFGYVQYYKKGEHLFCKLPSGRTLCYPFVSIIDGSITFKAVFGKIHWMDSYTYSGKLFENICQAISRDILLNAIVNLHKAKIPVVATIHDEIIAYLRDDQSIDEMINCMLIKPKWAETLPLAAEGFTSKRYEKR